MYIKLLWKDKQSSEYGLPIEQYWQTMRKDASEVLCISFCAFWVLNHVNILSSQINCTI